MNDALFTTYDLGGLTLRNRIVMAPLTRNRANLDGDTPSDLTARYYAQRAGAGLIISEGCQISLQGKGYYRTPGIFTKAQITAWKRVTDAVHASGGHIFCQLWHVGRVSHTMFQPGGEQPVAPSAIKADAQTYGPQGMMAVTMPRHLEAQEMPRLFKDFEHAAYCAREAGFDGVEIHAANGYLIDQFLRESSNQRDDQYGGSKENRVRMFREVVDAITCVWSPDRVGFRISPFSHAGGIEVSEPMQTFLAVARSAANAGLAYMHVVEGETGGDRTMERHHIDDLRSEFGGTYMANNGYDRDMASRALDDGADLICFGRPFIANPDLPERLRHGAELAEVDESTLYGGGAEGYIDYPFWQPQAEGAA
ncbi:MAG: alkene reductase [Pseudomonadota bacterium]